LKNSNAQYALIRPWDVKKILQVRHTGRINGRISSLGRQGVGATYRLYWPRADQIDHILPWTEMEVSFYYKQMSRISPLPVGRAIQQPHAIVASRPREESESIPRIRRGLSDLFIPKPFEFEPGRVIPRHPGVVHLDQRENLDQMYRGQTSALNSYGSKRDIRLPSIDPDRLDQGPKHADRMGLPPESRITALPKISPWDGEPLWAEEPSIQDEDRKGKGKGRRATVLDVGKDRHHAATYVKSSRRESSWGSDHRDEASHGNEEAAATEEVE